jgi:hypothetical protein
MLAVPQMKVTRPTLFKIATKTFRLKISFFLYSNLSIYMPKPRQSKKSILESSSIEAVANYIKKNDGK